MMYVETSSLKIFFLWKLKLKCLIKQILNFADVFTSESHPQQREILSTLERLKADGDRDVRYFANPVPEHTMLVDYEDDAIEDIDVETVSWSN